MLQTASKIYIGRQSKYKEWAPDEENRDEIMAQALGRSGTLRAPTLKSGKEILVGFSEEMYRKHLL